MAVDTDRNEIRMTTEQARAHSPIPIIVCKTECKAPALSVVCVLVDNNGKEGVAINSCLFVGRGEGGKRKNNERSQVWR